MTVSIKQILAITPDGTQGSPLSDDELGMYLANYCNTDEDKRRTISHALRDELYRDGGVSFMEGLIDKTFQDQRVRELRKAWVPYARFSNPIRRVVHELSTVYSEHARRYVANKNENYQRVLELVHMHERALEISRLLNLHRSLLVGFRVRMLADGKREPVLDVVTPASFRPVLHPNDSTLVVGWLVRTSYRSVRVNDALPAWTLWTDHESVQLRADMTPIGSTYKQHNFGVCPLVPVVLGAPAPGFWPGCEGDDLVAAHIAIWFNNVLLLKETKSANKQTVIQGDGARTARGQAADSEVPGEIGDGQSVTTIDTSMDLSLFRDTTDHVLTHAGLNYGLPPAVMNHQGVQSAEARDLMRIPLKELRRQQQLPLRRFEEKLARVMAAVIKIDMPELEFDPSGWRMEFAESETPLDPIREHELFEKRRAAGIDNTIAFLMRQRPGMTLDQAWEELAINLLVETERNRMMRPLQAISGSLGASVPTVETQPHTGAVIPPADDTDPENNTEDTNNAAAGQQIQ